MNKSDEEDTDTGDQHQKKKNPRLPGSHVYKKRPFGPESQAGQGKKATRRLRSIRAGDGERSGEDPVN